MFYKFGLKKIQSIKVFVQNVKFQTTFLEKKENIDNTAFIPFSMTIVCALKIVESKIAYAKQSTAQCYENVKCLFKNCVKYFPNP